MKINANERKKKWRRKNFHPRQTVANQTKSAIPTTAPPLNMLNEMVVNGFWSL
jgi:hypothetical protein